MTNATDNKAPKPENSAPSEDMFLKALLELFLHAKQKESPADKAQAAEEHEKNLKAQGIDTSDKKSKLASYTISINTYQNPQGKVFSAVEINSADDYDLPPRAAIRKELRALLDNL